MRKEGVGDFLDELINGHLEEGTVNQMTDVNIREVSTVDQPATGRRLRFFKALTRPFWRKAGPREGGSAPIRTDLNRHPPTARPSESGKQQEDLTGFGSDQPGEPTGGGPQLANLTSCLAAHPDWSPAECEAESALQESLEADREGDDSTVSDPPTAGDFNSAKEGMAPMPRKAEMDPLEPMPEVAPEGPAMEAVEVPASPTVWPFSTCIQDAMDQGIDQDPAIAVCQIIREELGDPDDDESILLPDGITPEGAIQMAGIQAGILKPEGMGGGESAEEGGEDVPPEQQMRFIGKNRWKLAADRMFRQALGLDVPKSIQDRTIRGLRKEVDQLKTNQTGQEALIKTLLAGKSKEDLIQLLMGERQALWQALGLPALGADAPAAGLEPDPATASIEAELAAAAGAPAKSKSELDESEREELDRLRTLTATGSDAAPVADTAPPDDSGSPPPGIPLVDGGDLVTPMAVPEVEKAKRASVAPAGIPGGSNGEMVHSSVLGGSQIHRADRQALGWD